MTERQTFLGWEDKNGLDDVKSGDEQGPESKNGGEQE